MTRYIYTTEALQKTMDYFSNKHGYYMFEEDYTKANAYLAKLGRIIGVIERAGYQFDYGHFPEYRTTIKRGE